MKKGHAPHHRGWFSWIPGTMSLGWRRERKSSGERKSGDEEHGEEDEEEEEEVEVVPDEIVNQITYVTKAMHYQTEVREPLWPGVGGDKRAP